MENETPTSFPGQEFSHTDPSGHPSVPQERDLDKPSFRAITEEYEKRSRCWGSIGS